MTQTSAHWAQEPREREAGILPDARVIKRRAWLILASVALTVGAALLVSSFLGSSYTAQSQLVVTPVAGDDGAFTGLSVIRESSDGTRDVTTLTAYAETEDTSTEAGRLLAQQGFTPEQVLAAHDTVEISPVASSFLVSIAASADEPEAAAAIANAYADATVAVRQATFNAQLGPKVQRAQAALAALPSGPGADGEAATSVREELVRQVSELQEFTGAPDPSFQVLSSAVPPLAASGPGLVVIIAAAAAVGLILGLALAVLYDTVRARRVEDDTELLDAYGVPILSRVPVARNAGGGVLLPHLLRPRATQAYQGLCDSIETLRPNHSSARVVAFIGTGPGAGTSTSAFNTAVQLAANGHRVLLIDADLRRHSLSDKIPVSAAHGTRSALERQVSLRSAVVPAPEEYALDLLLVNSVEGFGAGVISLDNVRRLIAQAGNRWDFVLFDTAGSSRASEVVPLASAVDDVIVTVRRGHTPLDDLEHLMEMFARNEIDVRGFVTIGGKRDRVTYAPGSPTTPPPGIPSTRREPSTVSVGENA